MNDECENYIGDVGEALAMEQEIPTYYEFRGLYALRYTLIVWILNTLLEKRFVFLLEKSDLCCV